MDYPVKPGNDRKGKMSENDTNKKVMAFVVVILRLDRSILKRDNRSRRQIARSSRTMTEREERRKMMLRGAGDDINSAMTERGECQVITVRESSRIMTVYCVVILSSDCRAKSESPGGFGDFSGDRH